MTKTLSVAISPCPNDSFIFAAWVLGLVPEIPDHPARFTWADVDELNRSAAAGEHDVVKLSTAAALELEETYEILPTGGAFGAGAGPKLLARPDSPARPERIAVPGLKTTAFTVLRAALGHEFEPVPMLFSDIVRAVARGDVDAGLCIHETALLYRDYGLDLTLDLGAWWAEHVGGTPMPLGVIAARRTLPAEVRTAVAATIRASLLAARADSAPIWPLIRTLAQELDEQTLKAHIEAYVTDMSLDMGPAGTSALDRLRSLAHNP